MIDLRETCGMVCRLCAGLGRIVLLGGLLVSLFAGSVWGQEWTGPAEAVVKTQWTASDGLPVNSVTDMVRTPDGYLWLATYDGLVRYDGREFRVYHSANYEGLPSNRILDLSLVNGQIWLRTESRHLVRFRRDSFQTVASSVRRFTRDREGAVWIGTMQGVDKYHTGKIRSVAEETIRGKVQEIWREENGTLWIGTVGRGLYRRSSTGRVQHLTTEQGLVGETVGEFARAADGSVLIGSWSGLQSWNSGQLSEEEGSHAAVAPGAVFALESQNDGTTWAFTRRGVYRYTDTGLVPIVGQDQRYTAAAPPNGPFVAEGPEGHRWIACGTTLYRNQRPVFRTEELINRFLITPDGTVWLGTATEGLIRLRRSTFAVYGEPEGLKSENIYPVEQRQNGTIWVGTLGGGLARIDSSRVETVQLTKGGQPLKNIWALHEDRSGRFWVGGSRLCAFAGGRCLRPRSDGPIVGTRIRAIYEDSAGRLWIGTEGQGLYRCDRDCARSGGAWTQFTAKNSDLPHSYVRTIHETPNGNLWVGTNGGGIARYRNGKFASVTTADGLSSNLVRDLYQDSKGALWAATEDQGLNLILLGASDSTLVASVTTYQKQDGLYDNALHQILEDDQGRMWMSSNRGIFWVEKDQLIAFARGRVEEIHSVSYTTSHGLRSREANGGVQPAGLEAADGRLWFPTQEGVAVVDPATIRSSRSAPPLHVEAVRSQGQAVRRGPEEVVPLGAEHSSFTIEYTGIHLSAPERVRFRYRLVGLQDSWQEAGARRNAFFTTVPPGEYTFQVQSRMRGGEWSQEPVELTVSVAPYFYETWWFYGLCVLGIGLLAYGAVRYWMYLHNRRRRRLKRKVRERTEELAVAKQRAEEAFETVAQQAQQLREIDEMKSRLFVNVSHELRTPLALLLGPIQQILDENTGATDEREMLEVVQRNAKRLQRLVRQILNLARYDAGRLELSPERVEWSSFVEERLQRLVPLAEARRVDLSVDTSSSRAVVAFDPDHMETVVANLVRNAITYTPKGGEVHVIATANDEEAELAVEDTGPGIPVEEQDLLFDRFYRGEGGDESEGTGLGLTLTQALVRLHGGTIELESEPGQGSRFVVRWAWPELEEEATGESRCASKRSEVDEWNPEEVLFRGDGGQPIDVSPFSIGEESIDDEGVHGEDRTTILVVDDNADVRQFLRRLLRPKYRVLEAENGIRGLERARAILPDLIVADVMMPEMDGFAMVERLRQSTRTASLPIVMLTARADEGDRVDGLDEGADAYLTKPFDAHVLRAQIDRLLTSRKELRERVLAETADVGRGGNVQASQSVSVPETFEERVRAVISDSLVDPDFTVQELAEEVGVTRRTATRKVKDAFGKTPSELIRTTRVEKGAELLDNESGTISEVAYAVGFSSLSYFSRTFKSHFGMSPSEYIDRA